MLIHHSVIVGREYYGLPSLIQLFEEFDNVFWIFRIEISGRLIPDNNFRIMDERACYTRPLDLPSREELHKSISFVEHTDLFQYFWDSIFYNIIPIPTYFHSEGDIFIDCFFPEKLKILKHDSEPASIFDHFFLRKCIYIPSFTVSDMSRLRSEVTDEHLDEARLTASRCTYEKYEFSGVDRDRNISDYIFLAISYGDSLNIHDRE